MSMQFLKVLLPTSSSDHFIRCFTTSCSFRCFTTSRSLRYSPLTNQNPFLVDPCHNISSQRLCSSHVRRFPGHSCPSLFSVPSVGTNQVRRLSIIRKSSFLSDKEGVSNFIDFSVGTNQVRRLSIIRKSSFLSDKEGVSNFIDLLGEKEKRLLMDGLIERMKEEMTRDDSVPDSTFHESFQPPSRPQLKLLFAHQLLPFVGFGFLDNLIMILAGEYIDTTIGVTLGISTMAAAGLGNALSDVAGIGSAWYVEQIATRLGIKYPNLSARQESMKVTKFVIQFGRVVGVFLGCLLGMFPLLFIPSKSDRNDTDKTKDANVPSPPNNVSSPPE